MHISWERILKINRVLPCGDIIEIKDEKPLYRVREQGDFIEPCVGKEFSEFFDFVLEQQYIRRTTGIIPKEWVRYCSRYLNNDAYLYPRWTFPFCYFGKQYSNCFSYTVGLDVGCNVRPISLKKFYDSFVNPNCDKYLSAFEVFLPHYRYYRNFGCNIRGIDIRPFLVNSQDEEYGDLRMLNTGDSIIDFFTVAMIFGPGNPACTFLDVALCLGELKRTLRKDGLVYIADFVVKPSLVLCASKAGFRTFANNFYQTGVPIGLFLIRNDADIKTSCFRTILEYLSGFELSVTEDIPHRILYRELLRKANPPPMVESTASSADSPQS